jgi:glycine cleavage system H lipoate-binding protein
VEVRKMSVILVLLFVGIAIGIGAWAKSKRARVPQQELVKAKVPSFLEGIFVHPGHAWVEVLEPNLVAVGADDFTRSIFGSVEELSLPEPGTLIQQGGRAWRFRRGSRQLAQTSPISGRVEEVNRDLLRNPQALVEKDSRKNWMLKVRPIKLKRELKNLLRGNMLSRWNQSVKEQLVATLSLAEFPVLQEGGEIKSDLGDELTAQQWQKVTREFFNAG